MFGSEHRVGRDPGGSSSDSPASIPGPTTAAEQRHVRGRRRGARRPVKPDPAGQAACRRRVAWSQLGGQGLANRRVSTPDDFLGDRGSSSRDLGRPALRSAVRRPRASSFRRQALDRRIGESSISSCPRPLATWMCSHATVSRFMRRERHGGRVGVRPLPSPTSTPATTSSPSARRRAPRLPRVRVACRRVDDLGVQYIAPEQQLARIDPSRFRFRGVAQNEIAVPALDHRYRHGELDRASSRPVEELRDRRGRLATTRGEVVNMTSLVAVDDDSPAQNVGESQ